MSDPIGRYMPPSEPEENKGVEPGPDPAEDSAPSIPPHNEDAPRYGQRSQNWGTQPASTPTEPERPWPVYSGGQAPTPPPPGPAAYAGPTGPMPSRAGAIWMLVIGLVCVFILPIATAIGIILGSTDFGTLVGGMGANGSTVTVDDSGTIGVFGSGVQQPDECTLSGDGGQFTLYQSTDGVVSGTGITPGSYTIDCGPAGSSGLMVMQGGQLGDMVQGTIIALIVASVIGVIGIGLTIGGIVWLVSRNRARREYMRTSW